MVVVLGVVDETTVIKARDQMWAYIEMVSSGKMKRADLKVKEIRFRSL